MDETNDGWSAPTECRICRHPIPRGCEQCFRCGTPQAVLSRTTAKFLARQLLSAVKTVAELSIHLALIILGLYICFSISPILTLFPLVMALTSRST